MENALPHDIDAEEAVLGSLLLGADIKTINLSNSDFYSERNGNIYDICCDLNNLEIPIDQLTVSRKLSDKNLLDKIGGVSYISELITCTPTSLNLTYYADIVKKLSVKRKLRVVGEQIIKISTQLGGEINEDLNKVDDLILDIRKETNNSIIISPVEKVNILVDRYLNLLNNDKSNVKSTGIKELDLQLGGGLYNKDLTIIAGRTGMGKTTLMQYIANNMALSGNVLIFSGEMDINALGDRDVASIIGVPINVIRAGNYDDLLMDDIEGALEYLKNFNIYTYDATPITTTKIMQAALSIKLRYGLAAIFVDYLGLLDDNIGENRNLTLGYMTRKLKQIAQSLDIPVVALHQLSRELEKREDKHPVLPDLRESGHIEEDSDGIIFVYRDSYYYDKYEWNNKHSNKNGFCPDYPENIVEIIVAKQRQGETGKLKVFYDKKHQSYLELETNHNYISDR